MSGGKKTKKPPIPPPARAPVRRGKDTPGSFEAPENDLERQLIAFRQRRIEAPQFLEHLLHSKIFVATNEKGVHWEGKQARLAQNAALFCMGYPEFQALAIFTSASRATPASREYPEFRFAMGLPASEFVSGLTGRFGLIINPYWDLNLVWNPDQVDCIRGMLRRGR